MLQLDDIEQWQNWAADLFLWDPRWETTWEATSPPQQITLYRQSFTVIAWMGRYMVIIYLTYELHPSHQDTQSIINMFQAKILLREANGLFQWSIKVDW